MFTKLDEVLFELANKSTGVNEYNLYLASRGKVKEQRHAIEARFKEHFVESFSQATRREKTTQTGFELADGSCISLIEDDELAESVAAGDIARRLKNRCHEQLFALTRRMGELLYEPELEEVDNPFNPCLICNAFKAACDGLNTDVQIKLILLQQFESFMSQDIESIYSDLNERLIERNVLPKIRISIARNPARSIPPGSIRPPAGQQDLFSTLQQLLVTAAPQGFATMQSASRTQAVGSLTRMQHGDFRAVGLSDSPLQGATNILREIRQAGFGGDLPQMDVMTLDIVAMLFDYILDDKNIPDAMRALIGRLQIPVLKVAMLDKKFFARKSHPARRLLDVLAQAAIGWSDGDGNDRLYGKVASLVQQILSDFEEDIAIFAQVLSELEEFLEEEEKLAKERAEAPIREMQERERAEIAQVMAQNEIARRSSENVPEVVKNFLRESWQALLTIIYKTDGEDGESWKEALAAMDDLVWSVKVKQNADERKRLVELLPQLLQRLKQGMERAGIADSARETFFSELMSCHASAVRAGLEPSDPSPAAPSEEPTASLAPEITREIAQDLTPQEPLETRDDYSAMAARLERGTWVEFKYEDESRGRAKLTWVSPLRRIYLFTNRQGLQPLAIPLNELDAQFRQGCAQIIHDAPLVDRAVTSMLNGLRQDAMEV
jgi:hypothetical protein